MSSILATIAVAALCSATLLFAATPSIAVPSAAAPHVFVSAAPAGKLATTIQYRERYQGRRGYRNGNGDGAALAIGALIIGGIILSEAARVEHRQSHSGDWQRCSDTFRSFEPDTGLYTGYDGVRRTCPYLR